MHNDWIDIDVLEAYLNGKLDAKTMHKVERVSLEDPFVAQALAGLTIAKNRNLNLSILQKQLKDRVEQRPVEKKRWRITTHRLSIAATAAVLFISVSLFFFMRENERQNQEALANNKPKKVDVVITAKDNRISNIKAPSKPEIITNSIITEIKPTVIAKNKAKIGTDELKTTATTPLLTTNNMANAKVSPINAEILASASANKTQSFTQALPSRTTDVNMPNKTVMDRNVIKGKTNTLPSVSDMLIASKGNGTDTVANTTLSSANARLGNLNEAVIAKQVAYATVYASATPINGWASFQSYLKDNNRLNNPPVGKTVTLSFKVNSRGWPAHIKVLASAGSTYNSEAIRLLKDGGRWTYSSTGTNTATIKVSF
jgi:hypothetical protein